VRLDEHGPLIVIQHRDVATTPPTPERFHGT